MGSRRGWEVGVDPIEAGPLPHRSQGVRQPPTSRAVVADVIGGHHVDAHPIGDANEVVVADRVERMAMVPDLDEHVRCAERRGQPFELSLGRRRPLLHQRPRHHPTRRPGENDPVLLRNRSFASLRLPCGPVVTDGWGGGGRFSPLR